MEDLREKVYECTLAVEAHMICDLLARAGISARVDGEFLAGAGGELPLGSTIKVRVDPSARRRSARSHRRSGNVCSRRPSRAAIRAALASSCRRCCFLAGLLAGGVLVFLALKPMATFSSAVFKYNRYGEPVAK